MSDMGRNLQPSNSMPQSGVIPVRMVALEESLVLKQACSELSFCDGTKIRTAIEF